MSVGDPTRLRFDRLGALLHQPAAVLQDPGETCELCATPIDGCHRHLLEVGDARLLCTCRPCSLLFDRAESGAGHYRLVPEGVRRVTDLLLDEQRWLQLAIPVEMAFFVRSSRAGRVRAFYPSPAGPVESLLDLEAWTAVESANPILAALILDVEALLVSRAGATPRHWVCGVDECYRLVALIRTGWRGLGGGSQVWREVDTMLAGLDGRGETVTRFGTPVRNQTAVQEG